MFSVAAAHSEYMVEARRKKYCRSQCLDPVRSNVISDMPGKASIVSDKSKFIATRVSALSANACKKHVVLKAGSFKPIGSIEFPTPW